MSFDANARIGGIEGTNPHLRRPWVEKDIRDGRDKVWINVFKGGVDGDGNPKRMDDIRNYVPQLYSEDPIKVNATLRRDEWKTLDEALIRVAEYRLQGLNVIKGMAGLVKTLDGMSTTVYEWHDIGDFGSAQISMDGVTRGLADRPNYTHHYIPLPIIHADWEFNQRALNVSRRMGSGLDVEAAERAGRRVMEFTENMLFTADGKYTNYAYGGGTIRSFLTHPDRNTKSISGKWTASTKTTQAMVNDLRSAANDLRNDNHYGPYWVFLPKNFEEVFDYDYVVGTPAQGLTTSQQTLKARVEALESVQGCSIVDSLPNDQGVMVQLTSDVIRWIVGMDLMPLEWAVEGGMVTHYKVMTIQLPQVRSTQDKKSGVLHITWT